MRPLSPSSIPLLKRMLIRKLAHTKTKQGTDKASEHNGRTLFLRDFLLLTRTLTGLMSTSSYHLSSIHYTSSQFAPTYLFASASATDRVRRNRQSMPPPTQAVMKKHMTASPSNRWTRLIQQCRCNQLMLTSPPTTAPLGTHPSSAYEAAIVTTTTTSSETLVHVKGWLIHVHGLKNIRQYSTFISSSDDGSDTNAKTITARSSASKRRRLGRERRWIPEKGQWSDPTLNLDVAISMPPFYAASARPLSASSPSLLSSSSASASVCLLQSLPSSSRPTRFLHHSAICPLFRTDRLHHISVTPAYLPLLYSRHLHNILYLHPHPPPPSLSQSSIFLSIYLSIYILSINFSLLSLSLTLGISIFTLNV